MQQQPQMSQSQLFSLIFSDNSRDISDIIQMLAQQNLTTDPMDQILGMQNNMGQMAGINSPIDTIMDIFNNPNLAFLLEGGAL